MLRCFYQCMFLQDIYSKGPFNVCTKLPTRNLYDFRCKSYGANSGFNVLDDLDL